MTDPDDSGATPDSQAWSAPSGVSRVPRVVITEDAPAPGVLASVRALRAAGYEPWVAVPGGRSYSVRSRDRGGVLTVPQPATDPQGYVRRLANGAAEIGALAVLPGTELALQTLAGAVGSFAPQIALGSCPVAVVRRATDKRELARVAEAADLPTPPTRVLAGGDDCSLDEIVYPAVIKPLRTLTADGAGRVRSVGVRRIESQAELRAALGTTARQRWLVQTVIPGRLQSACGVAWRGEVVCMVHQVSDRIYPLDVGISAYARTIASEPGVERKVRQLIADFGWSGIFQLQMIATDSAHYAIDLNPRPYGSLALAVAAGLNLPAIWTDRLLGRPRSVGDYRIGVRYRSEERDTGAIFAALMAGNWRMARDALRPRRRTVHAVFALRDPLPSLAVLGQFRRAPELLRSRSRPA